MTTVQISEDLDVTKLKAKYEVETIINPLAQLLIDKYGEVSNWPKIEINNRKIICKGCMQEFESNNTKDNIFDANNDTRVLFVCPNCGTHNSIKKIRLDA